MIITIVGLGLMGGSLALALRGFHDAHIIGVNRSEQALREALDCHAIDEGYVLNHDIANKAFKTSDLVILCQYPNAVMSFLEEYAIYAKPNSLWTDVAGIKTEIIAQARHYLPENVEFLGAHPMAGREVSGFDAAIPTLFDGCNYVLCPTKDNSSEAVDLLEEMARYVGSGRITHATPEHHDAMIAYTSQMAHALAAAIVDNPLLLESKGFEGGSFRDLTRVATLNPEMWSELFVLNSKALNDVLKQLEQDILTIRKLIESRDQTALLEHLAKSTKRKEEWKTWPL